MTEKVERVIALGASNLTRGFHTVVSTARVVWGPRVQILAALGHGRSYGVRSRFLFRFLPGILDSGIWQRLQTLPDVPARALVTDVGNDILYGFPSGQVSAWVEESIVRLKSVTNDIVLTGLPLSNIGRLSEGRFLFFRSLFVPTCRLTLDQVAERAEEVEAGLAALADAHDIRFFPLPSEWYGLDPIHMRPSRWRVAWQEILGCGGMVTNEGASLSEGWKLYFMAPERQWLCGVERHKPQTGMALRAGARVWLY